MANLKQLAIVVGAGASKEYSFPVGSELMQRISGLLSFRWDDFSRLTGGDRAVWQALGASLNQEEPIHGYIAAAAKICEALPLAPSIDQFIHSQRSDARIATCGKLAIVRAILEAEAKSPLALDHRTPQAMIAGTQGKWLNAFFRVLVDGCTSDELDDRFSALSLIVFNYDRCVEHYLFHALRCYFGISENRATELVRKIKIFHPYGSVGELPWQDGTPKIAFGEDPNYEQLVTLKDGIKTFTEGTDPSSSAMANIRSALGYAPRVVFLGFAYHQLNLELLRPHSTSAADARLIVGSALGISHPDATEIQSELASMFSCPANSVNLLRDHTANQIFSTFTRALSFPRHTLPSA